jgi:hypothetical protein
MAENIPVEVERVEWRLGAAFRDLGRRLRPRHFTSGRWFAHAVAAWAAHRAQAEPFVLDPEARHARAELLTRRACVQSALAGAGAAATTTAAEVATQADAPAGLFTLPLAGAAIAAEMAFRALAHLRLMSDLADLHGVAFGREPENLVRLYALAIHSVDHREPDDPGRDLVSRVVDLESHEASDAIGSRLIGESFARNVLPYVGVATSSIANWRRTARLGSVCRRYFAWRRLLDDAAEPLLAGRPELAGLLIEGLWFVFTADGRLTAEETAVLAHLVRCGPEEARDRVIERFVTDEADWLRRLRKITDRTTRIRMMKVLQLASAVDGALPEPERRLLEHAAASLRQPFSEEALRALAGQIAAAA